MFIFINSPQLPHRMASLSHIRKNKQYKNKSFWFKNENRFFHSAASNSFIHSLVLACFSQCAKIHKIDLINYTLMKFFSSLFQHGFAGGKMPTYAKNKLLVVFVRILSLLCINSFSHAMLNIPSPSLSARVCVFY